MAGSETTAEFLKRMSALTKDIEQARTFIEDMTNPAFAQDANALLRSLKANLEVVGQAGQKMAGQVDQLQGLTETAAMLNSSLEPQEVLDGVMDTLIRLTGAERAFVVLREGADLHIRAARNWDAEAIPTHDASFSRSIVTAALDGKQTILTTNAHSDARFAAAQSIAAQTLRSVLCVPLMSRGEAIGVIYADNRVLAGLFDQATAALATAFAQQAAVAIDNARRFEQVKHELDEVKQELSVLRIQIDYEQREQNLKEITDTDYFKRIQLLAKQQREANSGNKSEER
jgi:transcriptional regulator with GAF, ATPase, and Fis domain